MVAIKPFCALRFSPDVAPPRAGDGNISDATQVIAPPYDVIDPEQQEQLYRTSPHNIVRLILGKQYPNDTSQENRYTRAQRDFEAWRTNGTLALDAAPALYLIEHTFDDGGQTRCRLGFTALLQLDEGTPRAVFRHEATLAAPKEDRTKLLDAVPANLEPIFCLYPDEGGTIQTLLDGLRNQSAPAAQATFKGDTIRLWAVTQPQAIDAVARRLASVSVLIADGHHRFEVAYANRARYPALMSYFVSMADPSLIMRAIHRVLVPPAAVDLRALHSLCVVKPAADLASLLGWLERGNEQGCFGLFHGSTFYRVALNADQLARWFLTPLVPQPIAGLDVSILHSLILPHLKIESAAVRYTAQIAQALEQVKSGRAACAWLLRAIPLPQVYALAAHGSVLPPKSTYFYPKVPSGLTINPW